MKNLNTSEKKLRIYLMRHAQPVTYGFNNSRLSKDGASQILLNANKIIECISDNEKHTVRIFYSSRKRAKESGMRLETELKRLKNQNNLSKVSIQKSGARKIFQTADSIHKVIGLGYPLQNALETWIKLSPAILKENKIQTPAEVIDSVFRFSESKEVSTLTDLIAITHETTLMAFQSKYFPNFSRSPKYGEIMEININNATKYLRYRNKKVKIYA